MENILSSLNGLTEAWLTFGSASYHIDLNFTLLSGLGLLLLYICYLILKLVLPSLWKKKYSQKLQEKAKETRGSLKEEQAFISTRWPQFQLEPLVSCSPLGEPYDATLYDQLLHPAPLYNVCHRATSKVSHLFSQATLEDGVASHFCLASTAPGTKASFILSPQLTANQPGHSTPSIPHGPLPLNPSILSPNHFAPLGSLLSSTPLGDFLIPEPRPPLNPKFLPAPTQPYALASFTLPTKEAQESEVVLQLKTTISVVSKPSEVSIRVPTTKGIGYGSRPGWDSPQQRPAVDGPLSSDLAYAFNQHLAEPHASQVSLKGDLESGNLLPPNSDALVQLKRQDKTGGDFLTTKDEEKNQECFIKYPHSLEKLSSASSLTKSHDLAASHSTSSKAKHLHQQVPHLKTSEDHAEPKPTQRFWGPPSLHSEALHPPTTASLDHSSTFVGFNSTAEASRADSSPAVTLPTPLFVTKSQSQTWLQPLSQSHSQHNLPAESQAQPQPNPPISVLTLSPQTQVRVCGVRFHRPQEKAQPLGPSETQYLEYNILKKRQERVWGLPSVIQKSQDAFCPPPPKCLLASQSFKSYTPRPILPGDFPLTNELHKKLEHHLRKRLIQHRWGLPHRISESVSLTCPQSELVNFSESRKSRGLSWISLYKHLGSRESHTIVLSGSGSLHNGTSESHPLEETEVKAQTYSQDMGKKDHLQSNFQKAPANSPQSDLKTDQEHHAGSQSGQLSSPSRVNQCQKRIENALEEHLSRKTKEIRESQIPSTVVRSWHSVNLAQPPPETPPRQVKDLAPLAGEEDPLGKHQRSLSLSPSKEKMLEEHIKTFGRRMTFGLPQRVEESFESYATKVEPSHFFSKFHVPPHTVSGVNSGQSSRFLPRNPSGDRLGTMNFMPIQEVPLPASSPVRKMRPTSENKKVFVDKDLSIAQRGRAPIQPWTPSMVDKGSLPQSGSDTRLSPELPMRPDGPTDETLASSTNTQGPQGARMGWGGGSMAEGSTELLKEEELPGLHPQSTKILTATQGTYPPGSHGTPCQSLQGTVPYNPETSDCKSQVPIGVVLPSVSGQPIQVAGLPEVPSASKEMTSKCQGPSSGDMAASQVLQVHLSTVGVSMEPGQGPWFPAHVSGKCQNRECPPAAKGVSPLAAEAGKLGGGDAGLGTSQARGKEYSVQGRAPEETCGHTSSPALSPKAQPPENQFTNQVKCFVQWMSPGRKHKGEERSLAKGSSPSPSVRGTSLIKGSYEFCGNPEAQKCVRNPGVVLRKQLGHRLGAVIPCPQAPVPPLMGPEGTQQEVQPQSQAEPVQRHHSCCQAACSQVRGAESCSPGQGQTAPERCGTAGKAETVETSLMDASQGTRVLPKSCL
ncbi:spermatogenesis-associated protein 31D3-like [Peromyscus californicus insignis]|uniref:spermatogenesis-associated protein 31D3-like n=1 Tax=Peromyscus californicus insignis TaxID=564181 RepID=UPI0022A6C760|nr:spermatogenesis-associated protein 31D3-like [Peromyscus californicus insignis]